MRLFADSVFKMNHHVDHVKKVGTIIKNGYRLCQPENVHLFPGYVSLDISMPSAVGIFHATVHLPHS
jgi:hypothetical protein